MCQFATHNSKVFCTELKNQSTDLISIAVDSGEVERLASLGNRAINQPGHDDKSVYLMKDFLGGSYELTRWDIAARQETHLATAADKHPRDGYFPSLDDQWLIRSEAQTFWVRPMSGGDWRSLVTLRENFIWLSTTTPDGSWLLYLSAEKTGKRNLFRVPIAGGPSQPLGEVPKFPEGASLSILRFSPDGNKIVAEIVKGIESDLWVLESFVPPAPKR
jgi:hypothetical protein